MENNAITNEMENVVLEEVLDNNEEVVANVTKGSFGKNALIVAGLAGASFAMYKLGKKVYKKIKARKDSDIDITDLNKSNTDTEENATQSEVGADKVVDIKEKKTK